MTSLICSSKVKSTVSLPRQTIRDWRFWCSLAAIALLAAVHAILDLFGLDENTGSLYFLPISLYWLPVIYCAWVFGFSGALIAAVWVLLVSVPDFIFLDQASIRVWEIAQVAIIIAVASSFGFLVDQKRLEHERAKVYAAHSLRTQEEERRRISRDLHDNAIQSIVAACRQVDGLRYFKSELPGPISDELLFLRKSLEQTVIDLREFSKTFRPFVLDDLGVVNAIRQHLTEMTNRNSIQTQLDIMGSEKPLTAQQQESLYRIFQEGSRNAESHSQATQLNVKIVYSIDEVVLEMSDNGVGFEIPASLNQYGSNGHFGILGMQEYAEVVGGHLEIRSGRGKGTRLKAFIPLKQ